MKIEDYINENLLQILEKARLAPSVHNSQPWQVTSEANCINIAIDPRYQLTDGDPTGRETIISLGIFTEAICMVAADYGLKVRSARVSSRSAVIVFREQLKKEPEKTLSKYLNTRFSDRSVYSPALIDDSIIQKLEHLPRAAGITIRVTTQKPIIEKTADLTGKAIRVALSNPAFVKELSGYLVEPWSRKRRGISVKSLQLPWLVSIAQPIAVRYGLGADQEAKHEKIRFASASALVFITADGDLEEYWFETGRAYMRVSLMLEKLGLSQTTSAAIVEASNYHEDIEEMLHTNQRILSIIRVGHGTGERAPSPRVDATDLLTLT
jgi:hypothetical protein